MLLLNISLLITMGLIKITPENLAIIESASADTFVLPVDNDPVKLMSAIIMLLITVIEMDSQVFNLIKSDVALFLAAYKKIVGPEVVENMLKFISTYRNGGTEITLLGSSRMKGGVTKEQLEAAKAKSEAEGATPEDITFYNKTKEQFERERQIVVAKNQLQNFNNQQEENKLILQPVVQTALDLQRPDVNTVQTEFNNAYDVFATAFAELQTYRDQLSERESAIEKQLQKIKPDLSLDDSELLKLHGSNDESARTESAKKNIESLKKSIATVEKKIENTSVTEAVPLLMAACLSICGTTALVTGGAAVLSVAGVGLAASSLMSSTPTGILAAATVAIFETVSQKVENNPKPVMDFFKGIKNTLITGFTAVAQSHGDQFDSTARITEDVAKNRENILTSGVLDESGKPRVVESLISTGIRSNIGTTDTTLGPNLFSTLPSGELYYNVNLDFLDGQEFGYVPFPEERTEGPLLEDNSDEPSQWTISLKKMFADKIIRYVIISSVTVAIGWTCFIANSLYLQRKSGLETKKKNYNEELNQSINQVQTILNSVKNERQILITRVKKSLQDVRTERAELMKNIGKLHTEFTEAENRRLNTFRQLFREYSQAVAAAHAAAENIRSNQRGQQIQILMLATMGQGMLQQQAMSMLEPEVRLQLIGNENVNRIEPQEELDQGGSLSRGHRLPSLPTRRAPRFSSSKKKRYTHRRRALRTGKGDYRPTKTGRKV
jgi:hypothetical protein